MWAIAYFVILVLLAILISVFFVAMKCLVSFAIFADFFEFLHFVSVKHVFAKIATNICQKIFSTAANPCWICCSCYICYFFYIFLIAVLLKSVLGKLRKQFASRPILRLRVQFWTKVGLICQSNTNGRNCEKYLPLFNNRIRWALSTGGNHLRQLKDTVVSGPKKENVPCV